MMPHWVWVMRKENHTRSAINISPSATPTIETERVRGDGKCGKGWLGKRKSPRMDH